MGSRDNIIISNGFNQFPLVHAATQMAAAGRLDLFITGAYPTPGLCRLLKVSGLVSDRKLQRLYDRRGHIPPDRLRSLPGTELFAAAAVRLMQVPALADPADQLNLLSFNLYSRAAARIIARHHGQGGVYHYRSGFGQSSVAAARHRGMHILCDHSIAHPSLLDTLIRNGGQMPDPASLPPLSPVARMLRDDIDQADDVLVNSDFVKQTFLHLGWPADRVHVIYQGVDEAFIAACPPRSAPDPRDHRLMFAGYFEPRKGANILVDALTRLAPLDWHLDLVGSVEGEMAHRHQAFLSQSRVTRHGTLGRLDLAAMMSSRRIMVFPSLAEGSARVVTMAMAAGCFIITTPNAGSPVRHGIDGLLVPPGDATALADAVAQALAMGEAVDRIGAANAERIRSHFRQTTYGASLEVIYDRFLREGRKGGEA